MLLWLCSRLDAQLDFWATVLALAYAEVNVFGYTMVRELQDLQQLTGWERRR